MARTAPQSVHLPGQGKMEQTEEQRFRAAVECTEPVMVTAGIIRRIWRGIVQFMGYFALALMVAGLVTFAWLVGQSWAHQAPTGWQYPFMCCSDRDCTMLPKGAVKETPLGFVVTVLPGQHDFVKDAPVQFLIPYGQEKISPDGADHICLSPELKVLCFFTGSKGF